MDIRQLTMIAFRPRSLLSLAALAGTLVLGADFTAPPAKAQAGGSCQTDMEAIAKRRVGAMEELNRMAKAGKGKLDPIAACPRLRALASVEAEFVAYLTKNKDWCGIPDTLVQNMTESHGKTLKFAAQACNVAAQVKKMQQQAAQQQAARAAEQAPKLPAGPL